MQSSKPLQVFSINQNEGTVTFPTPFKDPIVIGGQILSVEPRSAVQQLLLSSLTTTGFKFKVVDADYKRKEPPVSRGMLLVVEQGGHSTYQGMKFAALSMYVSPDEWSTVNIPRVNGTPIFSSQEIKEGSVLAVGHIYSSSTTSSLILQPLFKITDSGTIEVKIKTYANDANTSSQVVHILLTQLGLMSLSDNWGLESFATSSSSLVDSVDMQQCGPLAVFASYMNVDKVGWPRVCRTDYRTWQSSLQCPIEEVLSSTSIAPNSDLLGLVQLVSTHCDGTLVTHLGYYDETTVGPDTWDNVYNLAWILPFIVCMVIAACLAAAYYFWRHYQSKARQQWNHR